MPRRAANLTTSVPIGDDGEEEAAAQVPADLPTVLRLLRRDLREAALSLSEQEVRFLVDTYYAVQDFRIGSGNQAKALDRSGEPNTVIDYLRASFHEVEHSIKAVLDRYTAKEPSGMGAWAREIVGIGPVLAAGLLAYRAFDPRFQTVGHTWSLAGLEPDAVWEKGQKRPWNADFKVLCWKIGESFVKTSTRENDIYGHLYLRRKAYEQAKNERKDYADQAVRQLTRFKIGADTVARAFYEQGLLPPGHIHARARRYCVKAFLADYFEEGYRRYHKTEPPKPYAIGILGHAHHHGGGSGWLNYSPPIDGRRDQATP